MTHDELLAKINRKIELWEDLTRQVKTAGWYEPNDSYGVYCSAKALRAVVELLKEYSDGQVRVNEEFNQGVLALSNVIKEAIEKELK